MGLIYNRTITVRRAPTATVADPVSQFNAPVEANLSVLYSNVPAQISLSRLGPPPPAKLADDANADPFYDIVLQGGKFKPGTFRTGDFITVDAGQRYLVSAPDWSPIGYTLTSQLLVA